MLNSIKTQIATRLSSPLFGAFALSWITYNHKYLFILFSGGSIDSRLELARKACFPNWDAVLTNGILYPAYGAMVFLIVYPLLSIVVFAWWEMTQIMLKWTKLYLSKKTPVDQEEHNKLVALYDAMDREQDKKIADLRGEKATLETKYGESDSKFIDAVSKLNKAERTLNKAEIEIVQFGDMKEGLNNEIGNLEKSLNESRKELIKHKKHHEHFMKGHTENMKTNETLSILSENLQNKLKEATTEKDFLLNELKETQENFMQSSKERNVIEAEYHPLRKRSEDLEKENDSLLESLNSETARTVKLETDQDHLHTEIKRLKIKLEDNLIKSENFDKINTYLYSNKLEMPAQEYENIRKFLGGNNPSAIKG